MADTMASASLSFDAAVYRKLFPREYVLKCLENDVRPDGRQLQAARSVHIQTGVIASAASSSLVKIGNTTVMTAIKLAVGTPAVATPDQGEIAIQAHLTPLCSNRFSLGRPSEEAQSIGSQLMRVITGSRVVEMSTLSIERGKSAWKLFVDVYCVDHDGNVHDAALVSVMAALKTLRLPAVVINESDHVVSLQPDGESTPLKVQHSTFSTTFADLEGRIVVDPTSEEESLASSVFTITYNTQEQLAGVHKPGGALLAPQTLHSCMQTAKTRAALLHSMVERALASTSSTVLAVVGRGRSGPARWWTTLSQQRESDGARDRVRFVPGFGAPLETQYAGLVPVNDQAVGSLFYWFVETRMAAPADPSAVPLIVWLNGGPGLSSMTGLLGEMGPYRIMEDGKLIPHAYSWTRLGHMLFIDQPVGTGYSAVRDDAGYVNTQDEMATQLYRGLQGFYARHPEYSTNPVYLCGEAYAGKVVPHAAYHIHTRNLVLRQQASPPPGEVAVPLTGVAIGNGLMWPVLQTRSVPDFAIALGLIDSQQYESANVNISLCEEFHRLGRHIDAFQVCQGVTEQIYKNAGNPFMYDIRKSDNTVEALTARLYKYFNDDATRRALNVPPGTSWTSIDGVSFGMSPTAPAVARHLQADEMQDVPIDVFRDLLDNYKFLFYAGNMDGSAGNNLGVGRLIDRLAWTGNADYRSAPRQPWRVKGQVAGLAKTTGNMSYVVVTNAGHLVATDQPEATLDMMQRFLAGQPFFP
ncbi:hypothetical protein ATCC90586_002969 [Pythium insidiosum]|nr:hypothetical protein ATCC90586_002969 [Pythium insidiosum]